MILTYPFRLISKDKDWEKLVREYTILQHKEILYIYPVFKDDLYMCITTNFTNKKHCNTQNLLKGICDALQGLVYENDKQIKHITVLIVENAPSDAFEVVIDKI